MCTIVPWSTLKKENYEKNTRSFFFTFGIVLQNAS